MSKQPRHRAEKYSARGNQGFHLVELLVAVGVTTIFMAGILDALSLSYRQSTATQNQVIAANVFQQLVDDLRQAPWNNTPSLSGPTMTGISTMSGQTLTSQAGNLLLVKSSGGQLGHSLHPRALVLDLTESGVSFSAEAQAQATLWNRSTANCATVTERFSWQTANEIMRVDITIDWPSDTGTGRKQLVGTTFISQSGIHN